jgi:hypothetical protein
MFDASSKTMSVRATISDNPGANGPSARPMLSPGKMKLRICLRPLRLERAEQAQPDDSWGGGYVGLPAYGRSTINGMREGGAAFEQGALIVI